MCPAQECSTPVLLALEGSRTLQLFWTLADGAQALCLAQAWKEKGQGLLTVRQPAGEGTRPPQVVFTTESGRVLVNAALYRGVKVVPQARLARMWGVSQFVPFVKRHFT